MDARTLHLLATYLLLCLGTFGLWLGEAERTPPYPALVATSAVAAFLLTDQWRRFELGVAVSSLLGVAILLAIVVELRRDNAGGVLALGHFLIYLQVVKFFRPKAPSDFGQLYVVSLLQVAIACVVNRQVGFGATLVGYAALFVATLGLGQAAWGGTSRPPVPAGTLRRWFGLTATALPIGFLLFFLLPRAGPPRVPQGPGGTPPKELSVGFAESIRLDSLGPILENRDVVFNVWAIGPDGRNATLPGDILWRGLAFVTYVDSKWATAPDSHQRDIRKWDAATSLRPGQLRLRIEQIQPTGRTLFAPKPLFAAWTTTETDDVIFLPMEGRLTLMRLGIRDGSQVRGPINYNIVAGVGSEYFRDADQRTPTPAYLRLCRTVPESLARLRALAARLVEGVPADDVAERVRRVMAHLESGDFGYTLDNPPRDAGVDPIESFLFDRKRGHCEYFATALALLLREVGVPTRVLNGFKGADHNEAGGYYQVRQLLAHSWVEAYISREGRWQTLDPTPGEGRSQVVETQRSPYQSFGELVDAAGNFWSTWVVGYDDSEQKRLAFAFATDVATRARGIARQGVGDVLHRLAALFSAEGWRGGEAWTGLAWTLAVALAVLVAAKRWRRRRRRNRSSWRLYEDWSRWLDRRGAGRAAGAPPAEHAAALARRLSAAGWPAELVALPEAMADALYATRFGGRTLAPERAVELAAAVAAFRRRRLPPNRLTGG